MAGSIGRVNIRTQCERSESDDFTLTGRAQPLNDAHPPSSVAQGSTPSDADRDSRNAALTLALTLPGDTLLYLLLPLYAASFGVTLPEAGVLLAANRLIRIAGYGWVARFYAARGPRAACTVAAVGAILSTLTYAALSGVWLLLLGRLVWGLSFAAMNIANQALPTTTMEGAVRRTGRARAIIAVGPTLGLWWRDPGAVLRPSLYFHDIDGRNMPRAHFCGSCFCTSGGHDTARAAL